uniref:Uncharacterized protein n=1 Tax=Globodera rostochiensis TaxID=31243 RepID=A0A914H0F6_GLORO
MCPALKSKCQKGPGSKSLSGLSDILPTDIPPMRASKVLKKSTIASLPSVPFKPAFLYQPCTLTGELPSPSASPPRFPFVRFAHFGGLAIVEAHKQSAFAEATRMPGDDLDLGILLELWLSVRDEFQYFQYFHKQCSEHGELHFLHLIASLLLLALTIHILQKTETSRGSARVCAAAVG